MSLFLVVSLLVSFHVLEILWGWIIETCKFFFLWLFSKAQHSRYYALDWRRFHHILLCTHHRMEHQLPVNSLGWAQYGGVLLQGDHSLRCFLTFHPCQLAHSASRPRRMVKRIMQNQAMELQVSTSPCSWNSSSTCNINIACKEWLLIIQSHLADLRLT